MIIQALKAFAVIAVAILSLITIQYVIAQVQPPKGLQIPPTDLAQQIQSTAKAHAILQTIYKQMALQHNNSTANLFAHLKALTAQGVIDCPNPAIIPLGHCRFGPATLH